MHGSVDILQDLRAGWRIAVPTAVAQLLCAALFIAIGWPASITLMPEAPALLLRTWFGAAFGTPVGFLVGLALQRRSGRGAPRVLVSTLAVGSVILPIVGVGLISV